MKKIWVLALIVVLVGCVSVKGVRYSKNIRYSATDPKAIEVFGQKPEDRNFIEIGKITVDGASAMDQVERIFKIKAAEYGGDGVYVNKTVQHSRTHAEPHACHFYGGTSFPHGSDYGYNPNYHQTNEYSPQYYYCYGYNGEETVTFLTVYGIVIKYTS